MRRIAAASAAASVAVLPAAVALAPGEAASQPADELAEYPYCSTYVISAAEIEAGATSTVDCFETEREARVAVGLPEDDLVDALVQARSIAGGLTSTFGIDDVLDLDGALGLDEGGQAAASSTLYWARHYDALGIGTSFTVAGPSSGCDGSGVSFTGGDAWNDKISSTRHFLCGKIKHWADAGFAGPMQATAGDNNILFALNGTLNNQVSSIRYYAS